MVAASGLWIHTYIHRYIHIAEDLFLGNYHNYSDSLVHFRGGRRSFMCHMVFLLHSRGNLEH